MCDAAKKLDGLIMELGANNTEISAAAKIDRTNLSRFRNGSRKPKRGSAMTKKLDAGLWEYASKTGKREVLLSAAGCDAACTRAAFLRSFEGFLLGDPDPSEDKPSGTGAENRLNGQFGERLGFAVKLSGLSNAKLGRIINTDASLISKYVSGRRIPGRITQILVHMEQTLWRYISNNGRLAELAERTGCATEDLTEEVFFRWLFDRDMNSDRDALPARRFLEMFRAFPGAGSGEAAGTGLLPDSVAESIINSAQSQDDPEGPAVKAYFGMNGLREAVIRFLSASLKNEVGELWLFSEEKMDWMIDDEAFRMKWAALMSECVKKGIRITIIHNTDRDINELTEAVVSWLPLYMSGMIVPYYRPHNKKGRFLHTLFLSPGHFGIEACNIAGADGDGLYEHFEDAGRLSYYERMYRQLLKSSRPLISFDLPQDKSEPARPSPTLR